MKQASFQIGDSLNKEKKNVSESNISVQKEVKVQKDINKNTIINDTKTHKPRKLVENIYYF